jgi:transposase
MWNAGIDLSWRTAVVYLVDDSSRHVGPRTFKCSEPQRIVEFLSAHRPFRAVIEASGTYRWLYDLVAPYGEVILAHPLRLKAIWSGKAKTDKLDAKVLAELLRAGLIPESYVPPERYQMLRDLTRDRARLVRSRTHAQGALRAMLARYNIEPRYKSAFGVRGLRWLSQLDLPRASRLARDELVARVRYFEGAIARLDEELSKAAEEFPETEALTCIYGIGLYSALLVIAEFGEPWRFSNARKAGAYTGLTSRVWQSGSVERRGSISREGSAWLRWILVEAAMKVVRRDEALKRFYLRVKRRSGFRRARVAVARKLAEICWKRLSRWHAERRAA